RRCGALAARRHDSAYDHVARQQLREQEQSGSRRANHLWITDRGRNVIRLAQLLLHVGGRVQSGTRGASSKTTNTHESAVIANVAQGAFPSSQRRGGCAEGADGVVRTAKCFGRTSIEASPYRAGASRHPGAPASIKLSRHPSSARRGIGCLCAAFLLLGAFLTLHAQQPSFPGIEYPRGQDVSPTFDGWERNPDGTFSLWFGYFNRNTEEEVDVPLGPENNFDLGTG